MTKRRRRSEDDDDDSYLGDPITQCTTLDHLFPLNPQPDTRCHCGKNVWKPLIKLDDYLEEGMLIRTIYGGPLYRVEMVNESRARCRLTTIQNELDRAAAINAPEFLPMPGMRVEAPIALADLHDTDGEERGRIINISPRSVAIRVSVADLEQEALRSGIGMAKVASLPIGGSKSKKLTGAAAKAKANAKPKAPKTVRKCGCGCGGETTAFFVPGHDARYKGWMKKLSAGTIDLPGLKKLMGQSTFGKYQFKKKGAGHVPVQTYQQAAGVE